MSKIIIKKAAFYLPALLAAALFCSCQEQQSEAERNAEIERKVQERLAAERQAEEQQKLTQAQIDLDQRVKDLENQGNAAAATTPAPQTQAEPEPERVPRTSMAQRMRDDSGNVATATYSTFYTRLEPQGEWRETSNYGYVWQPRVAWESRDWRPYTNGRWVYTDAGWTWISDEPFGWATYHYGRWTRLQGIGWVWVPGNEWAPAWVSWRTGGDYVGWAPLPPEARFERGAGIHNWADNYYEIGPDQYVFCAIQQLGDERMERAIVPIERNVIIINQTTNVTNITYKNTTIVNQGPDYDQMRARSQRPIQRLRLERQMNVNFDSADPHAVVRGDVVEMPAPIIAHALPLERPVRVKETIAHVEVDRAWERMGDRQAAEKVRIKMKSEATPPSNAPSRTFLKPVETSAAAAAATPAPTAVPTATAMATPRATVLPVTTPGATAVFTPAATATAVHSPTPLPMHTPLSPPRRGIPMPSIPPETAGAPAGGASAPPTKLGHGVEAREQRKAERKLMRQGGLPPQPGQPLPSPAPLGTPLPASAGTSETSGASSLSRQEQRKQERKAKRAGAAESGEDASPSASTPPQ